MKKYIIELCILLSLMTSCKKEETPSVSFIQTDAEYKVLITTTNKSIEKILLASKPNHESLTMYKINLLKGTERLSKMDQDKILEASYKLSEYGRQVAIQNNINIDLSDLNNTIALGGIYSPSQLKSKKIENSMFTQSPAIQLSKENSSTRTNSIQNYQLLTNNEVFDCALEALGLDALFAVGTSVTSSWTIAAITRSFSAAAGKFLGPVGVAIAVGSFGYCLYIQSND